MAFIQFGRRRRQKRLALGVASTTTRTLVSAARGDKGVAQLGDDVTLLKALHLRPVERDAHALAAVATAGCSGGCHGVWGLSGLGLVAGLLHQHRPVGLALHWGPSA